MEKLKQTLSLSKLTLGTMRFADKKLSVNQVLSLLENCFNLGITTHHSSLEYSSYQLYTEALAKFQYKKKVKHIVKLSSPHFEDDKFSKIIIENRVDNELKKLNTETIDVLQWLVRSKPINDADRLKTLANQHQEIKETLQLLKTKGKIKSVFSFPYSVGFAEEVIKLPEIDGIISYLNKEELEYEKFAKDQNFIAIRPLFAGKLIKKENVENDVVDAVKFVQSYSKVISTIVGINTNQQLKTYQNLL